MDKRGGKFNNKLSKSNNNNNNNFKSFDKKVHHFFFFKERIEFCQRKAPDHYNGKNEHKSKGMYFKIFLG